MERKFTEQEMIDRVFEANKQRGKYLAFIVRELDDAGFTGVDEVLKKAIYKFGKHKAEKWGNLSAEGLMNQMMVDEVGRGVFGFEEIGSSDDAQAEFEFHRCPLEEGWMEMGLSGEERRRLCSIAREHDFGIVANDANVDLKLEMPQSIGLGNPVCHLTVSKK